MKIIITTLLSLNLLACVSSGPEDKLQSTAADLDNSRIKTNDDQDWLDLELDADDGTPTAVQAGCFKWNGNWQCCASGGPNTWQVCCYANSCD